MLSNRNLNALDAVQGDHLGDEERPEKNHSGSARLYDRLRRSVGGGCLRLRCCGRRNLELRNEKMWGRNLGSGLGVLFSTRQQPLYKSPERSKEGEKKKKSLGWNSPICLIKGMFSELIIRYLVRHSSTCFQGFGLLSYTLMRAVHR